MCFPFDARKLFHGAMCVFIALTAGGCQHERTVIDVDGLYLPEDHREVQWMEVLSQLPRDKNRAKQLNHLQESDSLFWSIWCEDILKLGPSDDTATIEVLHQFLADMSGMMTAIDSTSGHPKVLQSESQRLHDGLKRMQVIQSHAVVPDVVWMPSGFNFAIYPTSTHLAVGLDWFMGSNHPMHSELPPNRFPAYRLERMRSDRMANEAMLGWLLVSNQHLIPESPRTVDMWLYWGKIMHVLSRCMPDASPAELMNWSVDQWSWAVGNERATWAEMQPQERMFSKQPREVMRWFQEAPFTRVGRIPQESPDRLGVFLGWRAVEAALEAHPEWTTRDVLDMTDPQSVLRSYRP